MNSIASSLLSLAPLLLTPVWLALLLKAAALILRRTKLAWKHALVLGALATVVGILAAMANLGSRTVIPALLGALVGLALQLGLGGWYLKSRARRASGDLLGFAQGALLTSIAIGMAVVLGMAFMFVVPPPSLRT